MGHVIYVGLIKENEGYSSYAANLPGAFGEGDTKEEAINSVKTACRLLVDSYLDDGRPIPWRIDFDSRGFQVVWI